MKYLVLLAGCGLGDGSCIEEVILTYVALDKYGCDYTPVAEDVSIQSVNHLTEEMAEKRNKDVRPYSSIGSIARPAEFHSRPTEKPPDRECLLLRSTKGAKLPCYARPLIPCVLAVCKPLFAAIKSEKLIYIGETLHDIRTNNLGTTLHQRGRKRGLAKDPKGQKTR